MSAIKLPPLPEPSIRRTRPDGKRLEWYSADQLRAYRLAVAQAVIEACAQVCNAYALKAEEAVNEAMASQNTHAVHWHASLATNLRLMDDAIRAIKIEGEAR